MVDGDVGIVKWPFIYVNSNGLRIFVSIVMASMKRF